MLSFGEFNVLIINQIEGHQSSVSLLFIIVRLVILALLKT